MHSDLNQDDGPTDSRVHKRVREMLVMVELVPAGENFRPVTKHEGGAMKVGDVLALGGVKDVCSFWLNSWMGYQMIFFQTRICPQRPF